MNEGIRKAEYGVDAPGVIRNLFLVGIATLGLYRFLPRVTVGGVTLLLDEAVVSASSGKRIHRIVARKDESTER